MVNMAAAPCCCGVCCVHSLMHFKGRTTPKFAPSPGRIGPPPSSTRFIGPTRVHNSNGISIGSSVFVRLAIVTNRDRQTHADRYTDRLTDRHSHTTLHLYQKAASLCCMHAIRSKTGSPYSITERRVPELIPVLCSQPAGDVSHKPGGRLPLLFPRPAVTLATLKRVATSFGAW